MKVGDNRDLYKLTLTELFFDNFEVFYNFF